MDRQSLFIGMAAVLVLVAQNVTPAKLPNPQLKKLPSYLTPCSRSDPNVSECARKSGQAGIPFFINGDRKYKLPSVNPLEIIQLTVNQGTSSVGLAIELKNCKLYGLKDTVIQDLDIDLPNRQFTWRLYTPRVEVISNYNISGRVLLLPLFGAGNANLTLVNPKYVYKWKFTTEMRDGEEYMVPKKGVMTYELDQVYIKLENLFNGDQLLGPQMNKFLNENWRDASRELGPSIAEALSRVIDGILVNICSTVPYKNIFTP